MEAAHRRREGHAMAPSHVRSATRVEAAGHPPKLIDEYVGRVNTGTTQVSVAHMRSPAGWSEPAQTPEFDEYTIVLSGSMIVRHSDGDIKVSAGQAVITYAGECVQYSTPDGAEYIAVCLPAFAPDTVHREDG
jgi:ethanolamine utilization protein EutQ (cupin superfamily)